MYLLLSLVLLASLLLPLSAFSQTISQRDNEAKEEIISTLSKNVSGHYAQYKTITAEKHDNTTVIIYNQSEAPVIPIPPVVIPPNETKPPVNETTPPVNETKPPVTNETTPPIPIPPQPDKPTVDVNHSKFLRVATVGDIDNNNGLVTQLNLVKKYHTQVLIVIGDYGYSSCPAVIDKINAAGFTKANAIIVQGNHDCAAYTKNFNGMSNLYGLANFDNGKLAVLAIDGNSAFSCSSSQFSELKGQLDSSDAWYNIPAIHQPFVTVKSDHGANGQFACYNSLFLNNKVDLVLQAHNHNYQRFDISGVNYLLVGTGTHDTGSAMYPLNSDNWNGNKCLKCITGTNGITIIDLQIDNPKIRNMQGWFVSNSDQVKDKFNQ